MTSLPVYLGYKYFRSKQGAFASFTSIMAIAGLAIGVAALIIVLSVMNGFEKELQTRILGVVPQLVLKNDNNVDDYPALLKSLELSNDVLAASPYIETQGLVSANNRARGIFVTGIEPSLESSLSILPQYLVVGSLADLAPKNGIVIGAWLSRYLNIGVGDTVTVTTTNTRSSIMGSFPRSLALKVVGIFELKAELDQSLALIHHDLASNLMGLKKNQTQGIRLKVSDLFKVQEIGYELLLSEPLVDNDDYYFSSWQTTHGTLFQAIQLEKRLISLLLFLIIAVAAFNILSTLVMTVKSKEREIAILKTLGCSQPQLIGIFLTLGMIIGLLGITIGVVLGLLITPSLNDLIHLIEQFSNRSLLDSYFINYFPYEFRFSQLIQIAVSCITLSLIFSLIPALRAAKLDPVTILRHE